MAQRALLEALALLAHANAKPYGAVAEEELIAHLDGRAELQGAWQLMRRKLARGSLPPLRIVVAKPLVVCVAHPCLQVCNGHGAPPWSPHSDRYIFVEEPDQFSGDDWTGGIASGRTFEPLTEAEMRKAFEMIDTDGSGAISKSELSIAVSALGIARSEAELADVVREIDADVSGEIEFGNG